MRRSWVWATLLAMTACGGETAKELPPVGQLLLFIDTDAVVPRAPGAEARVGEESFVFDRLRVQVLKDGDPLPEAISLAQRDFPLHLGRFVGGPLSVGILPPLNDPGLVAKIQIFRSDRITAGEPPKTAVLESHVRLPRVGAEGKQSLFVMLHTDDVGAPRGVPTPIEPAREVPGASLVGTWARAREVPCAGAAGPNEACVPGGAFWLGDPGLRGLPNIGDAADERLVIISPFFLDRAEITVGEFRAAAPALLAEGHKLPPVWDAPSLGSKMDYYATYTDGPSADDPNDERALLPVNAVEWATADAFCRAQGKTLPSQAELEFVASGRGLERTFVWGNDTEIGCDDVVLSRAGARYYDLLPGLCRTEGDLGGALVGGRGKRDVAQMPNAPEPIVDLAGNLAEWTRDWFVSRSEPPFDVAGFLVDPVAIAPGTRADFRTIMGGSWRTSLDEARAASRYPIDIRPLNENRGIGFRCARAAK